MTTLKESKVVVVIPTYNEADSLPFLIREIDVMLKKTSFFDFELILIDDNSPDNTFKIAQKLKTHSPYISIVKNRQRTGFVDSLLIGYQKAIRSGADYVFQMDADLSHNPHSIPRMLHKLENHDVVIGSRYTKNGQIKNWGLYRRAVSCFGNVIARLVLGIPIKDITTGFRGARAAAVASIINAPFHSNGYVFQIECVHRYFTQKFSISESPILFTERRAGKSKFNLNTVFGAIKTLYFLSRS